MAYVDGFVLPVPKKNLAAYKKIARKAGKIWKEHGAIQYLECVADDVKPGKWTSFPRAVKLKDDEVVILSWAIFANKTARDRANKKIFSDPRVSALMDIKNMPFDGKRMFWGGFKPFVSL